MSETKYSNLESHITALGWIHIVTNTFMIFIGFIIFMIMIGSGLLSGDGEAFIAISISGIIVGFFMFVLSIPGVLAGIGLLKRKPWARMLAAILSALNLLSFPIGTAIGSYTLWVLLQTGAEDHFITEKAF